MAVLKSFDFAASRSHSKMPWDVLLDGRIHQLTRVEDPSKIKDPTSQFAQRWLGAQVKKYCQSKGIEVRVAGGGPASKDCVIQAIIAPAPKKSPKAPKAPKTESA